MVEVNGSGRQLSLLRHINNYGRKKFYVTGSPSEHRSRTLTTPGLLPFMETKPIKFWL
jgi:hypothetical protein